MTALSGRVVGSCSVRELSPFEHRLEPFKESNRVPHMEQCKAGLWDCENILQNGVESLGRGGSFQEVLPCPVTVLNTSSNLQ